MSVVASRIGQVRCPCVRCRRMLPEGSSVEAEDARGRRTGSHGSVVVYTIGGAANDTFESLRFGCVSFCEFLSSMADPSRVAGDARPERLHKAGLCCPAVFSLVCRRPVD